MSISTLISSIQRLGEQISRLQTQSSDETKKEAGKWDKINRIRSSVTKNTSQNALSAKEKEIANLMGDIATIQKKRAGIDKQIADKSTTLHKAENDLRKEQEKDRKKNEDAEKRRREQQSKWQKNVDKEVAEQKRRAEMGASNQITFTTTPRPHVEYDVFISHATEDKNEFVRPLAEQLQNMGFKVWYDEFSLRVGDSLRQKVDQGLSNSRYGIVVFSSAFFAKQWTQYELNGLVAKEMNGRKVILPIWHKITKDEMLAYSPPMVDKLALNSANLSIEEIADLLAEVLRDEQ